MPRNREPTSLLPSARRDCGSACRSIWEKVIMRGLHRREIFAVLTIIAAWSVAVPAQAQAPQSLPQARIVVTGEGSVTVPPDYAEIRTGVTTRGKSAKEALDANSKLMTAVTAALQNSGVEQK